jgi:pimeloyl-ACP methyl ester carboxylesterase
MRRRQFIGLTAAGLAMGALPAFAHPGAKEMTAEEYRASRKFVHTRFGRVAYVERGAGEAALFLHGFPLNGFQWRGVLGPLSQQRRCVAPDFLALGYTEVAPNQDVSPDSQVAMLVEFMDKLGIGKADVVANDSGGAVAQLLAVSYPARVRSLLLTNCDSEIECPPAALKPVIEMSHAGTFVDQWFAAWLADKALARSETGLGGQCYADRSKPTDEAIECYLRPLVGSQRRKDLVHAYAIALEPNILAGVEARLRSSAIPTRIVWGDADTIFSNAGADYLHSVLGRSLGVRKVAGSKLFWPEERPDVLVEEARALWKAA